MSKILVVDDEASIATLLQFNLEENGYQVDLAHDGKTALDKAINNEYAGILLDLMLPEMDGMTVLRQLRESKSSVPVLLLTAKGDEFDRVLGLELGADDYITKPFSVREVLARLKAVLRRSQDKTAQKPSEVLNIADLVIDLTQKSVTKSNQRLTLTPREFQLLEYFANRIDRVIDRHTILEQVWGFDYVAESRMVDMHISNLRDKIENDPKKPELLKTVRGFGYVFGTSK